MHGGADSKPQLTQEHPQQHPQLRGTAYRARYLAGVAQKKEPSAMGMDRLFLVAWMQGIRMCNVSLSAAFSLPASFLKAPWSWACVRVTCIGLIAKAGSPNAFHMFWI